MLEKYLEDLNGYKNRISKLENVAQEENLSVH